MKRIKKFQCVVAVFLTVIMVFSSFPMTVFADVIESIPNDGDLQCIMRWLDTNSAQDYLVDIMENDAPPFCEYCKLLMKEHTSNLCFQ